MGAFWLFEYNVKYLTRFATAAINAFLEALFSSLHLNSKFSLRKANIIIYHVQVLKSSQPELVDHSIIKKNFKDTIKSRVVTVFKLITIVFLI